MMLHVACWSETAALSGGGGEQDYNTIYHIYTDTDYIYKLLPREQTNLNYFLWGKSLLTSLVVVVVGFFIILLLLLSLAYKSNKEFLRLVNNCLTR